LIFKFLQYNVRGMKTLFILTLIFGSTSSFAQEIWGEAIHCEKPVFLSAARSVLNITLKDDAGTVSFGKLKKDHYAPDSYLEGAISVKKTYQDAKSIEITDQGDGSQFSLVMKFKKLIDAETLEYSGDVNSPKKNMNNMKCSVRPVQIR
jgi:hypothetical protein